MDKMRCRHFSFPDLSCWNGFNNRLIQIENCFFTCFKQRYAFLIQGIRIPFFQLFKLMLMDSVQHLYSVFGFISQSS